ncbi:MAG: hypothetical protein ACRCZF_04060 [Gemmataceae bacterium]
MARKAFLLRVDEKLLRSLQEWADEDLRSLNGHIEFLLRAALQKQGRPSAPPTDAEPEGDQEAKK